MNDTRALRSFERFELKYWGLASQLPELVRFISQFLEPDARDQKNVSVYLDTPALGFYREHLAETPDRFKLRLRRYDGQPDVVFAEIKRKVKSVVLKTRALFAARHVDDVLAGQPAETDAPRHLEQFCLLTQVTRAEPQVIVTCERLAFRAPDPIDGARLTIDHQISYQPWRGSFFGLDPRGERPIDGESAHGGPARAVMIELKFPHVAPMWMAELVERFRLKRTSFSKYCSAIRTEHGPLDELSRVATEWRGVRHEFPLAFQEG